MKNTKYNFIIKSLTIILFVGLFSCASNKKEYEFEHFNTGLSTEERVNSLLSQMTLEEKVGQLVHESNSIPRLGIPEYNWWNESLHGVARAGLATVFPQAIGLAATWDTEHMFTVANVISDEARAKHHYYKNQGKFGYYQGLTFWSPNINIFRDPRWGRGMETYGEDPYLTGTMGVEFIRGLQGDNPDYLKVVATAKHYAVHSGPEPDRHVFDAVVSKRDLYQTYLPAFKMAVEEAKVQSIMCAYNRVDGEVCCGSHYLLEEILRNNWGFEGYVVSDCGAIKDFYDGHNIVDNSAEAAALGVKAGTDLNCGKVYNSLPEAVENGLVSEEDIDIVLKRLFTARIKLGMLDSDEDVVYAQIPYDVLDSDEHKQLALESARKSIVLLQNNNELLPLSKSIKTVAVIGPNANDHEVLHGNYNGFPSEYITPLKGIENKLPDAKILYAQGSDLGENLPTMEAIPGAMLFTDAKKEIAGLHAEYYDNSGFEGEPGHITIDSVLDFKWWDKAPFSDLDEDNFAVRWSGGIVPKISGEYYIGLEAFTGKLWLDGELISNLNVVHRPKRRYKMVNLVANKFYPIRVELTEKRGESQARLEWAVPDRKLKTEAMKVAAQADVVLMFMGLSPQLEGEEMKVEVPGFNGGDRVNIDLPEIQSDLIKSIHSLGKPIVLVLLNGSALAINWEKENISAIIEAWYPGQSGGTAIADILFGDYNPSGRLPITFYKSVDDLPPFNSYNMDGRTYKYFKGEALYDFGHGLSYSDFVYDNFRASEKVQTDGRIKVSVDVKNIGPLDGEEVVQLYASIINSSVDVPIRTLVGYKRVLLKNGEKRNLEFSVNPAQLSIVTDQDRLMISPQDIILYVGGKQPIENQDGETGTIQTKVQLVGESIDITY